MRAPLWLLAAALIAAGAARAGAADGLLDGPLVGALDGPTPVDVSGILADQAAEIRELRERLDGYATTSKPPAMELSEDPVVRLLPVVVESPADALCGPESPAGYEALRYRIEYDQGFVLSPVDADKHPFELKFNGWIQFRHHAFSRDADTWTDNAGVTRPIYGRNAFDIERARLVFSGYAQDPRLTYFLQLDGDTDGGHTVDFFDYWWAWECSDRFRLQVGKRKVTASRQWLLGARSTRLADRPMACDFFRPDRTVGLFGTGNIGEAGAYELMVGNGYQTADLPNASTDDRVTFAATHWLDPWGDFGVELVDFDCSRDPLLRVGSSWVYSPQSADAAGAPVDEDDFVRLTDGTRLTDPGALAPGVTVSRFDIYFCGLDAAVKWRGWSLDAEVFLRWIEDIQGNGPLGVSGLFQRGFYVEGGRFLVPKLLDVNARYSQVNGLYGDSSEYAVGVNWRPLATNAVKLTFDVTLLDGSPVQNTASDILVGDNGVMFRSQFQAEF